MAKSKNRKIEINKPGFRLNETKVIIAVAVLVIIIIALSRGNKPSPMEAEKITAFILEDHEVSFAKNGIVDETKLQAIKKMDYENFKSYIKATSDFCMNLVDWNGKIILAKGSPKLTSEGVYCTDN